MVRVKICGITNYQDALDAIELGADALGFNTFEKSKRFLDLKNAAWIADLPPFITKVAVMVDPSPEQVEAVYAMPFIDLVQFHGHNDISLCHYFGEKGRPFMKALALNSEVSAEEVAGYKTRQLLLDSFSSQGFGGTGKLIDLELAADFVRKYPDYFVALSGGLTPDNIKEAILSVRPYAVDVASGVESAPGKKDKGLLERFIRMAKEN